MSSERIVREIGQPLSETQAMLVEGVAMISSTPLKITGDCRACLMARLDDPAGGQPHAWQCAACGVALPAWEQAEQQIAGALRAAVGARQLPAAAREALRVRLAQGAAPNVEARGRGRLLATLALVAGVLCVLGILVAPQAGRSVAPTAAAVSPGENVARARRA